MITCKEDLIGTYIDKSDKELLAAWFKVVKPMIESSGKGLEWFKNDFCCVESRGGVVIVSSIGKQRTYGKRELTLSDFKPTRTEYVKVEGSIFDLKDELEAGGLYYSEFSMGKKFVQIGESAERILMGNLSAGNVYRKVEREISWQDEFSEYVKSKGFSYSCNGAGHIRAVTWENDEELKEMCNKVYHLTN